MAFFKTKLQGASQTKGSKIEISLTSTQTAQTCTKNKLEQNITIKYNKILVIQQKINESNKTQLIMN